MGAPLNDILVVIPGIMGSSLAKDGREVWNVSGGAIGRALISLGSSITDLTLSGDSSTGDGVTATGVLADAHMIPYFWKIDGYSGIARYFASRFDIDSGENFFEFPYDWRLDNRIAAQRLGDLAGGWLDARRMRYRDARLIIVAHSMGGLVARYFLEKLGGWRDTRMLVTLGTPHRGSIKALDFLVNGLRKKLGPLTLLDLSTMLRSFPSVYQLLPIYPCVGDNESDLARLEEIDELGELDMERAKAGVSFHREIERAVEDNMRDPDYVANRYRMLPVVGTYQPTFLSAIRSGDGITPLSTYKGEEMLGGDGTVPRFSATPIELSGGRVETFVACPHAGLQNFDPVLVQIRAALQDVDISELKATEADAISLEITDAFTAAEPFHARAKCMTALDPLKATLTNLETGEIRSHEFEFESDTESWQRLDTPPLPPGTYRIRVEANGQAEPVTDIFMVMERE